MSDFDESKHPRDRFGQFTRKGLEHIKEHPPVEAKSLPNRKFVRFERPNGLSTKSKSDRINLSKQEWAQYYKYIADEQWGAFIHHIGDERWVRLDTKIVIDNAEFEKPKIKTVLEFDSNGKMNDYLNEVFRWKKR